MVDQAAVEVAEQSIWQLIGSGLRLMWWVWLLPVALIVILWSHDATVLDYLHVLSGGSWTGIDLFLGFLIGPVMRRLAPEARRNFISLLIPRTLILLPVLSAVAITSGFYLAKSLGVLSQNAFHPWLIAAGLVVLWLFVQGFGVLLPTNLRVYREINRPQPDMAKVGRMMRRYIMITALQGVLQLAIIFIMANLAFTR
jgi:hypothetical protein